jgi:hypothetical protein
MATPPFPGGVDSAYIVFRCALIEGNVEYACLKVNLLFSHLASIEMSKAQDSGSRRRDVKRYVM